MSAPQLVHAVCEQPVFPPFSSSPGRQGLQTAPLALVSIFRSEFSLLLPRLEGPRPHQSEPRAPPRVLGTL